MTVSKPARRLRRYGAALFLALIFVLAAGAKAADSGTARYPSQPGTDVRGNAEASVDASRTGDGYVSVRYTGSSSKLKLQIKGPDSVTYTYTLQKGSTWAVFPLSAGSGEYAVNIYTHVRDNKYALAFGTRVNADIADERSPFLYPNQYVNYTETSETVKLGKKLVSAQKTELDRVRAIYKYVVENFTYDDKKAASVKSGYLPVVDAVLKSKKGICFDYAAVMTAMLRTNGIPTKLAVGYTSEGIYHAWITTYIADQGWIDNIIYFDGADWKLMDPTFASSGKQSDNIMKYIENNTNYSAKYYY